MRFTSSSQHEARAEGPRSHGSDDARGACRPGVFLMLLMLLLGVAGACTGPRGVAGRAGADCTVSGGDGGTKVITCADGTSVSVANGKPGGSCSVIERGDGGGRMITCDDGTSVAIPDAAACAVATDDAGARVIRCGDGGAVPISADPPAPSTVLSTSDPLPGIVVQILALAGASGPNGNFQVGDTLSVTFTVRTRAGADLPLAALDSAEIWIAGPTSGYQRVLPAGREQLTLSDVKTRASRNSDGSYRYTFASPLPATYGPPLFDTTKFSLGELTGQPLQHGTYTVALASSRIYQVGATRPRDVGSQTRDFLLGTTAALAPREIVSLGNCNQCHVTLQAHGGLYRDVTLCLGCHTAGAEDANSTDTGDATPVTIELATLIHKLHDGAHLPSVLGVGINADGTRNYAATPVPYVVGGGSDPSDFSGVQFPVWPSLSFPTPRSRGYTALPAAAKLADDGIRSGVIACEKCHGDGDGGGPATAPAQGDFAYSHPSRQTCGGCHDDVDWTRAYKHNTDTGMPAQPDDSKCLVCHPASGFAVGGSPRDGHRHPLFDPAFNPGTAVTLTEVKEAGGGSGSGNGNGKLDVGEKIAVTFGVTDGAGTALAAGSVPAVSVIVTGPTTNRNLLLSATIPAGALAGVQPFHVNLPEVVNLELLGASTATTGDVFTAARTPLWDLPDAPITISVATPTATATALTVAAPALQNFVTVAQASGLARNDYIVIDDAIPAARELLRIQTVDGNRLWFAGAGAAGYQPGLRFPHAAGATVTRTTLAAKVRGTDYTVQAATGRITEVAELGAGATVVASYTTDFQVPAVYGPPLNDSPDLGEAAGKWKGLPLVAGTYTVGLWTSRALTLTRLGESNTYRSTSPPATMDVLLGAATTLAPVSIIASAATCEGCHSDIYAHGGGRRGVATCLLCHGSAGTEDRPPYVAAAAPATPGRSVEFRSMLHAIHRGSGLAKAGTYFVVGFGAAAYPNNFSEVDFADVGFPAMPAGVKDCRSCHGDSTAWQVPADRTHPSAAQSSARAWQLSCGGCHDSTAATAHFGAMTSSLGDESCAVCHGAGRELATPLMHAIR